MPHMLLEYSANVVDEIDESALARTLNGELAQLFGAVRQQVDAVDPDLLVIFDTDHFAMWYYQRLPVFAIGIAEETSGPGTDDWPGLTSFEGIPVAQELGRHLYLCGLDHGFDLFQRKLAPVVITTGGQGGDPKYSEGGVGHDYLRARGALPP